MGTYWQKARTFEFDENGEIALGAKAFFYDAGTTTPRLVYDDADLDNPLEVDEDGAIATDGSGRWPRVFLQFGSFDLKITTEGGTQLFYDQDIPNPEPFSDDVAIDVDAQLNTGDFIFVGKNGTRSGAVRANGKTIGSGASGGTERANDDTQDLFEYLWNNYANGQCAVSTGRGSTATADFLANKTIAMPDYRGCALVGFDDMGNTNSFLMSASPTVTGSAILAGSIMGANTHTLQTSEIPSHSHAFSATTGTAGSHSHTFSGTSSSDGAHTHTGTTDSSGAHTHSTTITDGVIVAAGGSSGYQTAAGALIKLNASYASSSDGAHTHTFTTGSSGAHTHTYSGTTSLASDHTHSVSGTTDTTGGGTAHNNLQRSAPVTVLMKL
jgi:microcystin-dependent protein